MSLSLSLYLSLSLSFFGQVMSPHHTDQMSQRSQVSGVAFWRCSLNVFVFVIVIVFVCVFVIVFLLVRSCLLITLIKCLKLHKSLGSLCGCVFKRSLSQSVSEWVTRSPIELSAGQLKMTNIRHGFAGTLWTSETSSNRPMGGSQFSRLWDILIKGQSCRDTGKSLVQGHLDTSISSASIFLRNVILQIWRPHGPSREWTALWRWVLWTRWRATWSSIGTRTSAMSLIRFGLRKNHAHTCIG